MAGAARWGLVAATGALLAAGLPAGATDDSLPSRSEEKSLQREIAAKLKAFQAKLGPIQQNYYDVLEAAARHGVGSGIETAQQEYVLLLPAALQEFLDGLRDCLDDANADDPKRFDAADGSLAQQAVAAANTAIAKGEARLDRVAGKVQTASRKACTPIVLVSPASCREFNYLPPTAPTALREEHDRHARISYVLTSHTGEVSVGVRTFCEGPHAHTTGCDFESVEVQVTGYLENGDLVTRTGTATVNGGVATFSAEGLQDTTGLKVEVEAGAEVRDVAYLGGRIGDEAFDLDCEDPVLAGSIPGVPAYHETFLRGENHVEGGRTFTTGEYGPPIQGVPPFAILYFEIAAGSHSTGDRVIPLPGAQTPETDFAFLILGGAPVSNGTVTVRNSAALLSTDPEGKIEVHILTDTVDLRTTVCREHLNF